MITKQLLAEIIAKKHGLNPIGTKKVIDETFELITDALLNKEHIFIFNFGYFKPYLRKGRPFASNLKTSKSRGILQKGKNVWVVKFIMSKRLKEKIKEYAPLPEKTEQ
jgi:nucleoid DNA-binding protein